MGWLVSKNSEIVYWEPECHNDYEYLKLDNCITLRCLFDNSNCTWCRNVWGKTANGQTVSFGNMPYYHHPEEITGDVTPLVLRQRPQANTYEAHLAAMDGHRVESHLHSNPISSFGISLPKTEFVHSTPYFIGVETRVKNYVAEIFFDCPFRDSGVAIPGDF